MKNQIIKSSIFILINIFLCITWKEIINIFQNNYNQILNGEPIPALTESTLNNGLFVFIILIILCIFISSPKLKKVYDHCLFSILIIETIMITFLALLLFLPFIKIASKL